MRGYTRRIPAAGNEGGTFRFSLRRSEVRLPDRGRTSPDSLKTLFLTAVFLLALFPLKALALPLDIVFPGDTLYDLTSDSENKKITQITDAVKTANSRAESFSYTREEGNLRLRFSFFTNEGKAEFFLYGSKNDYYRLAMGKGGESLCDADERVEYAATSKTKEGVVYKVNFVGFDLLKKAEEDKLTKILQDAIDSNDPRALDDFAKTYKSTPQAVIAMKKSQALKEELAWERAKKDDTRDSLQAFLNYYPHSIYRLAAQKRLDEFKNAEKVAEAKRKIEEENKKKAEEEAKIRAGEEKTRKAMANAYASARAADNVDAYEKFLQLYPESPDAPAARERIEIVREDSFYEKNRGTDKGLAEYLRAYPEGHHAEDARKNLEELKSQTGDVLKVKKGSRSPAVDGNDSDQVWGEARVLKIPLQGGAGGTMEIRAIQNGNEIFFLAKWPDRTKNVSYRPWVRQNKRFKPSEEVDDAFSMALYMGRQPGDSCMVSGEEQVMDIWLWRAFWSELSGYAADKLLKVSRSPLPESNIYQARNGASIHVQNKSDGGKPAWELYVPIATATTLDTVPSYVKAQPSGSSGDVRAVGSWRNNMWTVEFSRKLATGNLDDVTLKLGNRYYASFAAYDHSEKSDHSSTKLITLDIEGK
jgi:outer membrane protein assembly factor BamD (BamD/ComL family)